MGSGDSFDAPAQPPRKPPAAPPNQNEELYEVVTTVGGSSKANVKFKITFTSADKAVQKKIFQAPADISWPYLQEKLQSMFSLQSLDNCEISWIDEDGDSINVQSSEDLVHALYAMKDTAFIKFDLLESKPAQNPTYDVATNRQSVTSTQMSSEYSEIHNMDTLKMDEKEKANSLTIDAEAETQSQLENQSQSGSVIENQEQSGA